MKLCSSCVEEVLRTSSVPRTDCYHAGPYYQIETTADARRELPRINLVKKHVDDLLFRPWRVA